jgi:DNA-binding MarR family transcriptional regulator
MSHPNSASESPAHPSERPSLLRAAARLEETLGRLSRTIQARDRERAARYDLSVSQFHALLALEKGGPTPVTGLAGRLHLEKSTASRLAKGLLARGLVRKRSPVSDDRVVILQATEQGLRLSRRILNDLSAEYTGILAGIDPPMREILPQALECLLEELELSSSPEGPQKEP